MSIFRVGPYRLDTERKILTLNGDPLRLGTKAVEVLIVLVERPGEVVTKDQILARVWPEGFVEEANLSQNVYMLRRTLQEHWNAPNIATVHGRGYRFVAPVEALASESVSPSTRKHPAWTRLAIAAAIVIVVASTAIFGKRQLTPQQELSAKGRQYFAIAQYDLNQRKLLESADYFRRVTKTDPRSPLGDAGMAEAYALMPNYGLRPRASAQEAAYASASEALQLDPNSPQAIAVLGFLTTERTGDPEAGVPDLRRAVLLDPSDPLPHEWLSRSLLTMGEITQAQKQLEIAQQLNPVSPVGQTWLGLAYLIQHRYTDAIDHLRRAVSLDPDAYYENGRDLLVIAYTESGNTALALSSIEAFGTLCSCPQHSAALRVFVLAHNTSTRTQAYADLRNILHARHVSDALDIAFAYIALGDHGRALMWLRRVVMQVPIQRAIIALDPRLDPVRSDSRFNFWTHPIASKQLSSGKQTVP